MSSGLDFILSLCAAEPSPPPSPIHPRSPISALRRPNRRRRDFGRGWLEVGAPHFSPSLLDLTCRPHLDSCSQVYGTLPTSPFFFDRISLQWKKTLRTSTSHNLLPCLPPHELPLSRVAARREAHRPSPRRHPLRTARRLPRLEAFRRRAMPILTHAAVFPAPRLETLLVFLLFLQCAHKRRSRPRDR
jgi:hypothetical protein